MNRFAVFKGDKSRVSFMTIQMRLLRVVCSGSSAATRGKVMTVPDYQSLMLPVLRLAQRNGEQRISQAVELLADEFELTGDERKVLLPSGKQTVIANRVHWAVTYMVQAGLLNRPRRGMFTITERGKQVLGCDPSRIDNKSLAEFAEFRQFRMRRQPTNGASTGLLGTEPVVEGSGTPEEVIDSAFDELNSDLKTALLERIIQTEPVFFEQLIIDLMLAMGYGGAGGGRHLGRSNDGGVDGIINEDPLGLDVVYLQAKRYAPGNAIGVDKIREFAGTLDEQGAVKGVFVTTSHFAPQARQYAQRSPKRLILIDGNELTDLLIRHDVGVRTFRRVELKRIDADYFDGDR